MEEKQKGGFTPKKAEEMKRELAARIDPEKEKARREYNLYHAYDTEKANFLLGKVVAFGEVQKMLESL